MWFCNPGVGGLIAVLGYRFRRSLRDREQHEADRLAFVALLESLAKREK
jgi:hypothetical protein